jgi:3-(3-hydroxy-phenyl)propionate hydroxylase
VSGRDPVVVAGAGPTGLMCALALGKQGIPVILCEAEPALTVDLRAGSFHPPTLEMMAPYGITQRMHETGIPVRHWQIRDRTGEFIAEFDLGLLADVTAYPYRLHLEQHRLTPIQLDILRRDTRVDVRFSHRVTGFAQHADGVTVTVDANGKPQTIAASWLIGADGGRSIVRKLLGVGFEGFTWPENFLVVSTPHDLGEYGYPYMAYVSDPLEWAAVFRMPHDGPPGIWRLAFPVAETMSEDEALGEESVERRMQGFLPRPGRWQIIYKSIYRVHQRVADTFRIGHVLLGGDAAHLNNPLGGFGLNSGIHDAINLCEKLGRVWRGEASDDVLDVYSRQRRAVTVEQVQEMSIRNKRTLEEADPAVQRERLTQLIHVARDPELARRHVYASSMLLGLERAKQIG